MGDIDVDGIIILKWSVEKCNVRMWTGQDPMASSIPVVHPVYNSMNWSERESDHYFI
jgi:NADH:ubiquinone oxidoreductase subunit C